MSKKKASSPAPQSGGGTGIKPPTMRDSMKRFVKNFAVSDKPLILKVFVVIMAFMVLVALVAALLGKV